MMLLKITILTITALFFVFSTSAHAEESILRFLIWEGYGPQKYVKDFEKQIEKKYNRKVKLDFKLAGSADDFYDAIRNKSVDVVTISHHTIKDARFDFITKNLSCLLT